MTTGNHETANKFLDLDKRFIMPNKAKTHNLYYSYDIKNAHFVSVNSEAPYQKQFTPEYILELTTWLEKDLSSTTKKWKIIYLHRPFYCSWSDDYHCGSSSEKVKTLYEKIIQKYNVDLVLAGHTHAYERLYPIFENQVDTASLKDNNNTYDNPKYPAHIVCGSAGNREDFANCIIIIKTR